MSRSRSRRRWTVAALLAGLAGIGTAGCIAVPVGGYDGYPGAYGGGYGGGYGGSYGGSYSGYSGAGPAIVFPAPVIAPSIVIAPGSRGIRGRGPGRSYGRGPSRPHRGG
jgi:hypothetical protein